MKIEDQIKNILAFLSIILHDKEECLKELMRLSPEYLIEKFNRYILSGRSEHEWGLLFDMYLFKWEKELKEMENE